jgi:hypothetical protein
MLLQVLGRLLLLHPMLGQVPAQSRWIPQRLQLLLLLMLLLLWLRVGSRWMQQMQVCGGGLHVSITSGWAQGKDGQSLFQCVYLWPMPAPEVQHL